MIQSDFNGRIVTVDGKQYVITSDIGEGWSMGALIGESSELASQAYIIFTDGQ